MLRGSLPAAEPRPLEELRERLRDLAVSLGFEEIITYTLTGPGDRSTASSNRVTPDAATPSAWSTRSPRSTPSFAPACARARWRVRSEPPPR